MAKVMGSNEPFPLFPPSDRELTLRAQIKTGWSTHSSISYVYHHHGLNDDEIKSIREVVERAHAVEHMEEIRIGLLMLKLKQKVKNCRGDGVSTCRICNCDFTRQRSSRPEPIQYCHDCHMMICSRCVFKNPCKVSSGDVHTLCAVCYEERELWMKSGAWLMHSVPAISIPYEDLEEIQQQLNTKVSIGLGRKREDVPLVNPYQLEDSDDDESMQVTSSSIKSRLHFNQSQSQSNSLQPKSSLTCLPSGSKLRSHSLALETKSFSDSEDQCTISQTAVKNRSLSRRSGLSRKGAVLGIDRTRLQQCRERMRSLSVSTSNLQSSSASRYSELTDRNGGSTSTLNGSLPSIKVSSIPFNPPPILNSQCPSSRSKSPESDTEPTSKHEIIIHQMHLSSSTDSDSIQISCDARKQEPVSANIQVETFGFSSVSSDHAAPVLKKKIDAQPHKAPLEEKEDVKAFVDEFKKINSPPCKPPPQGRFGMTGSEVGAGHTLDQGSNNEQDSKFMVADIAEDEFEKVKRSAVIQEAEVKKMIIPVSSSPKKKGVSSTRSVSVGDVGEFNGKSDGKSTCVEEELFKKVHVSSSDTKPVAQVRRKVPSLHSIGPPPAGPPPCPPLAKPRPPGPPPPGPPPKNLPQGSLSPAQTSMLEEDEEDPIITKSTVEKTPVKTFRSSLSHRNAFRESRNKRPPPCPNAGDNDKEEQPLHEDEDRKDTGRLRTRSRVIKGRRPQRGGAAAANHSPPISVSPLIFEEMGDVDGDISQQHPRPRVTSATSQDKIKASTAVLETSSKIDGEVSVTKWKPDGTFGSVQLTLQYSDDNLTVIVHSCKGLRAMDRNGLSDPYVKLFLTPRNKMHKKFRTKVVTKNLNPMFQEAFSFTYLTTDAMLKKTLCLMVMDYDDFSKDDFIGATQIKLYEVLSSSSSEICINRLLDNIVPKNDAAVIDRGAIHLSVLYSSEKKGLIVNVHSARNIAEHLYKGECEAFVKCNWSTKTRNIKERTKFSPKTNNPEFNEEVFFPVALCELSHSSLVVGVWEHRSFKDKLLSEVNFKSFSYWKKFVNNPETVVQDWYNLEAPMPNFNSYKQK